MTVIKNCKFVSAEAIPGNPGSMLVTMTGRVEKPLPLDWVRCRNIELYDAAQEYPGFPSAKRALHRMRTSSRRLSRMGGLQLVRGY